MSIEVQPQRPWNPSLKARLPRYLILTVSAFITYVVVLVTPMKGKLAYFLVFSALSTLSLYIYARVTKGKMTATDVLASSIMYIAAFFVFLPVISILATTIVRGAPGLKANLFTQTMSVVSFTDPLDSGGLLHAIIGTLYLILLSVVISVPLGILTALYLTEIKGPGSNFIQFVVQAMSGVPSVIAGLFIYSAVILTTPLQPSALLGGLALSILMTPTVTRTAQEVLRLIPEDLREAGLALGATQWKTVQMVVVPAARSGLVTAIILGIARIAGETAPLLFVLGGADSLNLNPLNGMNSGLPMYVWKGFLIGLPEATQRAWTAILILLIIVLVLFTLARTFSPKKQGR
ncbi:MAG: hypothetical protein RLZZ320_547 [Actinomycetota bacterium]|jgi:phosphate transport system permease protein